MSPEDTIRLEFDASLKVAGEQIHGEVHLYFPGLMKDKIEEVHVKLRGQVFTQITRTVGQQMITLEQRVHLVRENVSVWQQGNGVYPDPGSDVLKLPFTFELPPNLLPSCKFGIWPDKGVVQYSVQVVGQRPGIFRLNERVPAPFPLLPSLSTGAELRATLQQGWQGPWQTITAEKEIRRGIWGDRSHVKMALVLPDLASWPVFTAIPYTLTIITHSKSMKANDKHSGEQIFPAPPEQPHQIDFRIERDVFVRAKEWKSKRKNNHVSYLGGLGPSGTPREVDQEPVQIDTMDKVWIPNDGGEKDAKGRWKQEVVFKSSFKLRCPPTFDSETMRVNYKLQLKVDFPGVGNALKAELPLHIVSSMYPPGQGAWDGPPPEMDLPPEYYKAEKWSEKDEKS